MAMIPNSKVPSCLEAAWMLACELNDRDFCDDGMIPNSLKLWRDVFGYFAANLVNFGRQNQLVAPLKG